MLVAISGTNGLIGGALRRALEQAGHEVRALRRGTAAEGGDYDLASGWVASGGLAGSDAVVHLAGASIGSGRWTEQRRAELRSSRIASTRLLVDAMGALERRPSVLVVASAIGFYGDTGDRPVDESAPMGDGFLATLAGDWEAEARRAEALGVRVVSPRFGIVLARDGGALPQMALPFRLGAGGPIGNGRQWMSWISLPDTVGALQHLLRDERARGPVNVVAPEASKNRAFASALGKVLHRPAFAPAPALALRLVLGSGRANELLLASQRVVPQRLRELGYAFQHTDLDQALAEALRPEAGPRPLGRAA